MDINFLTGNPAVDEYNRAQKIAQDEQTTNLKQQEARQNIEKGGFELGQEKAEAPTRLRTLSAQADSATANAQKDQATVQYAGPQAQASLEQTRTSTAAAIQGMNVRQAQLHMDAFTKSLAALDQGDVESAKRISASVGDQLPDAVIQNSQMRAAIKNITATATQLYPGRPKDQMTYITAHMNELATQAQNKQPINPQTAPYAPAQGAPEPPEVGTAKPQRPPAPVATAEWLVQQGIAKDAKEAWGMAQAPKQNEALIRARVWDAAQRAYPGNPTGAQKAYNDNIQIIMTGNAGGAAGGGAQSTAPPQQAIDYLKANPSLSAHFDAKYGAGSAAKALGAQ